jgi:hypothetical protein
MTASEPRLTSKLAISLAVLSRRARGDVTFEDRAVRMAATLIPSPDLFSGSWSVGYVFDRV